MTEKEYEEMLDKYDKEFRSLIPTHDHENGEFVAPLIQQLEIAGGPEIDEILEKYAEEDESYKVYMPVAVGPDQGWKSKKIMVHSEFFAMNCVLAHKAGKLDFAFKNSKDGGTVYKSFINGEWQEPPQELIDKIKENGSE
jgi:hypothetical protein